MTSRGAYSIQTPKLPVRQTATLISRLNPVLNRPILIGLAALLASAWIGGMIAQTPSFSEAKLPRPAMTAASAHHRPVMTNDELSPLFLMVLGLAALALSQTRPSANSPARANPSCAGKKVARGQKLPELRQPQPPLVLGSRVIAGEHHDDVVRLEAVSGLGMLHK